MRNRIDDELQHIRKEARSTAQLSNPSPDPDPNPNPNPDPNPNPNLLY